MIQRLGTMKHLQNTSPGGSCWLPFSPLGMCTIRARECGPRWYDVLAEASVVGSFLVINELRL